MNLALSRDSSPSSAVCSEYLTLTHKFKRIILCHSSQLWNPRPVARPSPDRALPPLTSPSGPPWNPTIWVQIPVPILPLILVQAFLFIIQLSFHIYPKGTLLRIKCDWISGLLEMGETYEIRGWKNGLHFPEELCGDRRIVQKVWHSRHIHTQAQKGRITLDLQIDLDLTPNTLCCGAKNIKHTHNWGQIPSSDVPPGSMVV